MNKLMILMAMAFVFVGCEEKVVKANKDNRMIYSELDFEDFKVIMAQQPSALKLQEYLSNIGVRDAPYDKIYSANPYIIPWVFHLGKVRLDVQVERHEDGLYVSETYPPSATYDNMDRKMRMNAYYEHMGKLLKEKNKDLEKLDKRYFQNK